MASKTHLFEVEFFDGTKLCGIAISCQQIVEQLNARKEAATDASCFEWRVKSIRYIKEA